MKSTLLITCGALMTACVGSVAIASDTKGTSVNAVCEKYVNTHNFPGSTKPELLASCHVYVNCTNNEIYQIGSAGWNIPFTPPGRLPVGGYAVDIGVPMMGKVRVYYDKGATSPTQIFSVDNSYTKGPSGGLANKLKADGTTSHASGLTCD